MYELGWNYMGGPGVKEKTDWSLVMILITMLTAQSEIRPFLKNYEQNAMNFSRGESRVVKGISY